MRKEFSSTEISELAANPNTYSVGKMQLSLSLEAKQKILLLKQKGFSPTRIFKELGYDTDLLGAERIRVIVKRVEEAALSAEGIHQGYKKRKPKRMELSQLNNLDVDAQSIEHLKNEVLYLRQEVEFLKKLSQLGNMKKRGD